MAASSPLISATTSLTSGAGGSVPVRAAALSAASFTRISITLLMSSVPCSPRFASSVRVDPFSWNSRYSMGADLCEFAPGSGASETVLVPVPAQAPSPTIARTVRIGRPTARAEFMSVPPLRTPFESHGGGR